VDTILIVILVLLGLLLLAAVLGSVVATRRNRAGAASFSESLTAVDRQLAAATAEDHGWERATLDAAARSAFADHRPGVKPQQLELTQIVDEPGTDSDLAIYRIAAPGGTTRLTLGRREGAWYAKAVEDER
jgi:type II secretory pathway pseudopilin PulG